MSKLLFDEPPLVISPSLAVEIGLNEAIILQQVHYWLKASKHAYEGHMWIYNSYPEWQKQFPFWSEATVKRTIMNLEEKGLLVSGNFNKMPLDRTKWYRIDYDKVDKIFSPIGSNCTDGEVKMTRPSDQNVPTLPETPTETPKDSLSPAQHDFLSDVLAHAQKPKDQAGIADPAQDGDRWLQTRKEFIDIYHKRTGAWPNKGVHEPAISKLADAPDADPVFWDSVITAWIGRGYKAGNVDGMIEWYTNREIPTNGKDTKTNGQNKHSSHSGYRRESESERPDTLSDEQRAVLARFGPACP